MNLKDDDSILKTGEYGMMIKTDMTRVMQVLLGLQSNAVKFTKKGYVKHRIEIVEGFDSITE